MLIKALFTLRHKHKHKHKHKHNECSHLLHKHKESDIRKRNELQNEATGGWDEPRFQNGGRRRNFPVAIAAPQTKKTTVRTIPCSRAQLNNVHLPVHQPLPHHLSSKAFFFICILEIIRGFVVEAGLIANCLGKFLVENSILRRHFGTA